MPERKDYDKRLAVLQEEFESWKAHFKDITEYLFPRRGRYLDEDTKPNSGEKRNESILHNEAGLALRTLKAGMHGGLTSPARRWFKLTLADRDLVKFGPVKEWLEAVERILFYIFAKSNFYDAITPIYGELGAFGTGALYPEEDFETVVRFYPFTVGEYYIATDEHLRVNTLYRIYWMTASNMKRAFGENKLSEPIKTVLRNGVKDEWFQVVHLIEPNEDAKPGSRDIKNKPFRSVYYEYKNENGGRFLRESGYDSFPIMAPRWSVNGSDVYGISPGMEALGDIKMLQQMEDRGLRALDYLIKPPVNAPASLKNDIIKLIPGGVNFGDSQRNEVLTPIYQVRPDLDKLIAKQNETKDLIRRAFYTDLFTTFIQDQERDKTAYEISKMETEKLSQLGQVVGKFQAELIEPMIDRVFEIANRNGLIPPPPQELEGMDIEIEHVSPLAQAQKAVGVSAIDQYAGFVGSVAGFKPNIVDKFDEDEAADQYGDLIGLPSKIVRSDDEVKKIRQIRAQQEAALQQAEMAERMVHGTKALSETKMGENSALDKMLEGLQ